MKYVAYHLKTGDGPWRSIIVEHKDGANFQISGDTPGPRISTNGSVYQGIMKFFPDVQTAIESNYYYPPLGLGVRIIKFSGTEIG